MISFLVKLAKANPKLIPFVLRELATYLENNPTELETLLKMFMKEQ